MGAIVYNNDGVFYPSSMSLEGLMKYITNSEPYKEDKLVAKQRQLVIRYLNSL